ncbi:S1/P1 nuclease-domain-containing protein [Chytridium lagenaria]|nr:S1/P1 nuclease-domain-containing protein [Chytridium lagenaria]
MASCTSLVAAWGGFGHTVTGEMAQQCQGKALVEKLLDPKFAKTLGGSTASWADTWRSSNPQTGPWHYIDISAAAPQSCGYKSTDCTGRNCIVSAISDQTKVLLNNKCTAGTASTQAIQFLAHFLGDITQPLHNCNRARGGNDAPLVYNNQNTNFHAIHDTQVPVQRSKEVAAPTAKGYADYLISTYKPQSSAYTSSSFIDLTTVDTNDILVGSINMSIDANKLDCSATGFWTFYDQAPTTEDFSRTYYQQVKIPIEIQMAKGGFRMAAWINAIAEACSPGSIPPPPPVPTTPVPGPSPDTCSHSVCSIGAALSLAATPVLQPLSDRTLTVDPLNGTMSALELFPTSAPLKSTFPASSPWHYVDIMANSPAACGYVASDCADRSCIVSAITDQTKILLSNKCSTGTNSSQALLYLAHFIGDITQPMHNCNRQTGGNDATLKYAGKSSNFHAIHDTQIPVQRSKEVSATTTTAYATYLINAYASKAATYNTSTFMDQTSVDANNIYVSAINPSQEFNSTYYEAVKLPLEEQLAKGGYRIASWINAIAESCSSTTTPSPSLSSSPSPSPSPKVSSTLSPSPTAAACVHSVCSTGVALKSACSACAAAVIKADSYCGTTSWDSTCVDEVSMYCTGVVC